MKCTLFVSWVISGTNLAAYARLLSGDSANSPTHVAFDLDRAWPIHLDKSQNPETNEFRFVSTMKDLRGKAGFSESNENATAIQGEAGGVDEEWVDPPLPKYAYPVEDYLVIPNTRRFCEGSNILLATEAKRVGKFNICMLQPCPSVRVYPLCSRS